MDGLDIRIIRTMGIVPYGPTPRLPDAFKPEHIAKELGVSAETVRKRVARLEATGVIQGYELYPNLRHLSLEASGFLFRIEDDDARARFREQAALIDGIVDVFYFVGGEACMDMCYRGPGDMERKLRLLAGLAGGEESSARFYSWTMPKVSRPLSNLDWRIVAALRGRARRPLLEVAEDVGVSYRTVKRHYDRMAAEGSIFTVPLLDPGQDGGMIPFALLVYTEEDAPPDTRARVHAVVDDSFFVSQTTVTAALGNFDIGGFAPSPRAIEEIRKRVAAEAGVLRATALITQEVTHHTEWIDDAIRERVEATARPGRAGVHAAKAEVAARTGRRDR